MKLLVCGGRDYQPTIDIAIRFLDYCRRAGVTEVIHGAQSGADTMAHDLANGSGLKPRPFKAEWTKLGKSAGPIRNQRMLDEGKPDCVLAFPGGPGTADMVRRAKEAGVRVVEVGQ